MRRNLLVFSSVLFCLVYSSCQKNENFIQRPKFQDPFVADAIYFLKPQISSADFEKLDFKNVQLLKTEQVTTGVIIHARDRSDLRTIIIGKKNDVFKGNWLTKEYKGSRTKGIIHTESFDNSKKTDVFFTNNKVTKFLKTKNGVIKTFAANFQKKGQHEGVALQLRQMAQGDTSDTGLENYVWLPDVAVTYSMNDTGPVDNFYSLFWDFAADPIYMYSYTTDPYSYSADPYSYTNQSDENGWNSVLWGNVSESPTFVAPDYPIGSIIEELKCFANQSSSSYTITVNVNQPRPNSRDLVNLGNVHSVGHTYLTLEQDNSDGTKIIRNVGFYPKYYAKPGASEDASVFGEDSQTPASVSLKITVNYTDFNSVLQNLKSQSRLNYNVDWFNCSTSVIDNLHSININLPSTIRNDNLVSPFTGNDPADLGEDIRSLNLNNFSQQNGNRVMSISTSNANDLIPPARAGSCN